MGFNQKINDAMNNMSRAVTTQMMQDAPADLKYVYIGPVDEKTRPFCLDAASQGALTEEQILALGGEYAESLVSGGGINCRHNWELASDDIQGQFHRGTQAQKIIEEKLLTKPIEPLNVKSAGKHASVKDAENWAALHVANKVDYSKIEDIKVVNAINKNLLDLKNKGYGFYDKIEPLPARQFKKGIFASTDTVFYYGGLANNHDNLTKLIKKHQKDGWFIKSKNPIKQAIDHEFGHNLTHYHLSRMKDRNRNLGKAISKLKSKYTRGLTAINKKHGVNGLFLDRIPYKLKNGRQESLSDSAKLNWKKDRDEWFVSRYASTDADEFAAECFSMALNSDKVSPVAKEFMDILIKEKIIDSY